jgi:hypothetical protein
VFCNYIIILHPLLDLLNISDIHSNKYIYLVSTYFLKYMKKVTIRMMSITNMRKNIMMNVYMYGYSCLYIRCIKGWMILTWIVSFISSLFISCMIRSRTRFVNCFTRSLHFICIYT